MRCPHCSTQNDDVYSYCINCGKRLIDKSDSNVSTKIIENQKSDNNQKKSIDPKLLGVIGGTLVVLSIVIGIIWMFSNGEKESDPKATNSDSNTIRNTENSTNIPLSSPEEMAIILSPTTQIETPLEDEDIPPKPVISHVGELSEGLTPVGSVQGWGYIDTSGNLVIPFQFSGAEKFSEGLAAVKSKENYLWGYIDKSGEYVIQPQFKKAKIFSEGLAIVHVDTYSKGYINTKGELVIQPMNFQRMSNFEGGVAIVSQTGGYFGPEYAILDSAGNYVFPFEPLQILGFHEGLSAIGSFDSGWGFINREGKFVIELQYSRVGHFSEGLAPVLAKGGWGYINKSGHFVMEPQFSKAEEFSEGKAHVQFIHGGDWGYVDLEGNVISIDE